MTPHERTALLLLAEAWRQKAKRVVGQYGKNQTTLYCEVTLETCAEQIEEFCAEHWKKGKKT